MLIPMQKALLRCLLDIHLRIIEGEAKDKNATKSCQELPRAIHSCPELPRATQSRQSGPE